MSSYHHEVIQKHCSPLFHLCDRIYRSQPVLALASTEVIAGHMLGEELSSHYQVGGRSDLTGEGQPVMVRSRGEGALLIADPGWCVFRHEEQLLVARATLLELLHKHQIPSAEAGYERMMGLLLPLVQEQPETRQHLMTLGLDLSGESVVLNVRLRHMDSVQVWSFVSSWCREFFPGNVQVVHWLRALRAARFRPHSVMLTFQQDGELSFAFEAERTGAACLGELPSLPGLRPDRMAAIKTSLSRDNARDINLEDERIRVELMPSESEPLAVTFSLGVRCSNTFLGRLQRPLELGLDELPCVAVSQLEEHKARLIRYGITMERQLDPLHPEQWSTCVELDWCARSPVEGISRARACDAHELEQRMRRAVDSLLMRQHDEGQWPCLHAPLVGFSCVLPTAFVGWSLARLGRRNSRALDAARRAAQWSDVMRDAACGWGIGPHSGSDTLTTAMVLHLLRETKHVIHPRDMEWLELHWNNSQGGVAFSEGPLHWGDVHTDETALSWMLFDQERKAKWHMGLHEYLVDFSEESGLWLSYWWTSPWMTTYLHLMLFDQDEEFKGEFPVDPESFEFELEQASSFELAWACACAARLQYDDIAYELGAELLARQQIDGGWVGSQVLRLTSPNCEKPWEESRGELLDDAYGCLTTASALWALKELEELCQSRADLHYL